LKLYPQHEEAKVIAEEDENLEEFDAKFLEVLRIK